MRKETFMRAGVLAGLLLAARMGATGPAVAQTFSGLEVQASTMGTTTLFLGSAHDRFAIMRQEAVPLIVQEGKYVDEIGFGANAGVRVGGSIGIEGMFYWIPTKLKAEAGLEAYNNKVGVNAFMYGGTVLYHFPMMGTLEPFAGVGAGAETFMYEPFLAWERQTDPMVNLVVGANGYLTDYLAIRLEARDCLTRFDPNITGIDRSTEHDLMMSAGLAFRSPWSRK